MKNKGNKFQTEGGAVLPSLFRFVRGSLDAPNALSQRIMWKTEKSNFSEGQSRGQRCPISPVKADAFTSLSQVSI
jgi:hypothetical protein